MWVQLATSALLIIQWCTTGWRGRRARLPGSAGHPGVSAKCSVAPPNVMSCLAYADIMHARMDGGDEEQRGIADAHK